MGKRKTPLWHRVFLRALARTGNVSVAAAEAGVEPETAYSHRRKDPAFAARWAAALARGKANAEKARARRRSRAGELVLRRTGTGAKLVRATPGRWCRQAEAAFFDDLALTGCVQSAAAASGLSVNALYNRRKYYPDFAERWDKVEAEAVARLPKLLGAAGIASMDPALESRGLPKVNVDQAIRIAAMNAGGTADAARRRGGIRPRVATNAEVREALEGRLAAFRKRERARLKDAGGCTETADGRLIPPGWVYAGPGGDDGARPKEQAGPGMAGAAAIG